MSDPYEHQGIKVYFNGHAIAYCISVEDARRIAIAMNHVFTESNCISWDTSCSNCADLLDKLYAKDMALEAKRVESS